MNKSPSLPEVPSMLAIIFPLFGDDSRISDSIPALDNQSDMYLQTGVSSPVGINPVLTEGIRTKACSKAIRSPSKSSIC